MSILTFTGHYILNLYLSPIGSDWFNTGCQFSNPRQEALSVFNDNIFDSSLVRKIEWRVDNLGGGGTTPHFYPVLDDNAADFTPIFGKPEISVSSAGTKRLTDAPFIEDPFTKWWYFAVRLRQDTESFYQEHFAPIVEDESLFGYPHGATELLSVSFGKLVVRNLDTLAENERDVKSGGKIKIGTFFRVLDPSFATSTGNYTERRAEGNKSGTVTLKVTALNFSRNEISYKIVPQSTAGTTPSNFTFKRGQIVAVCNENVLNDLSLARNITGPFQTPLPAYVDSWAGDSGWGFDTNGGSNPNPVSSMFLPSIGGDRTKTHIIFHMQAGDYINKSFNIHQTAAFGTQYYIGHGECRFMLNGTNFKYISPDLISLHDKPHSIMYNLIFDGNYGDIGIPWEPPLLEIESGSQVRDNTRAIETFYNCSWIGPDTQRCLDLNIQDEIVGWFIDISVGELKTFRNFDHCRFLNFLDLKTFLGSPYNFAVTNTKLFLRGEIKNCTFHKIPEIELFNSSFADLYTKFSNCIFSECGNPERSDKLDVFSFMNDPDPDLSNRDGYFRRGGNLVVDSTVGAVEGGFLIADYMSHREFDEKGPLIQTTLFATFAWYNIPEWTIDCWWRPVSLQNLPVNGVRVILQSKDVSSRTQWMLWQDDDVLKFGTNGTGSVLLPNLELMECASGVLKTFQWHHIAIVFKNDTSPKLRMFVNGKMVASNNGYDLISIFASTTSALLNIGNGTTTLTAHTTTHSLYGDLARVHLHNTRALWQDDFEDNLPLGVKTFDEQFGVNETRYRGTNVLDSNQWIESSSSSLKTDELTSFTWCVKAQVNLNFGTFNPIINTYDQTTKQGFALYFTNTTVARIAYNDVLTISLGTHSYGVPYDFIVSYDSGTRTLRAWSGTPGNVLTHRGFLALGATTVADTGLFNICRMFAGSQLWYAGDTRIEAIEVYSESITTTDDLRRTFGDATSIGLTEPDLVLRSKNGSGTDDTGPSNLGSSFTGYKFTDEFFYHGGKAVDYQLTEPINTFKLFDDGFYYVLNDNTGLLYENQTHVSSLDKTVSPANQSEILNLFNDVVTGRLQDEVALRGLDFRATIEDSELFPFIDLHDNTGIGPSLSGGNSIAKNFGAIRSKGLKVDSGADNEVLVASGIENRFVDFQDGTLTFTNELSSMFVLLHADNAAPAGLGTHPYLSFSNVFVSSDPFSETTYDGSSYYQESTPGPLRYYGSYNVFRDDTTETLNREDFRADQWAVSTAIPPLSGIGGTPADIDRRVTVYVEFFVPYNTTTDQIGFILSHNNSNLSAQFGAIRGFKIWADKNLAGGLGKLNVTYGGLAIDGGLTNTVAILVSNTAFPRNQWNSIIIYFDNDEGARMVCSWENSDITDADKMRGPGTIAGLGDFVGGGWWNDNRQIFIGINDWWYIYNASNRNDLALQSGYLSSEKDKFQGFLRNIHIFQGSADLTLTNGQIPVPTLVPFHNPTNYFNAPYSGDFLVNTNSISLSSTPAVGTEVVADSSYSIDEQGMGIQWTINDTPLSGGVIGLSGTPNSMVALHNGADPTSFNSADFGIATVGTSACFLEGGVEIINVRHNVGNKYRMLINLDNKISAYQYTGSGFNLIGTSTVGVTTPLDAYFIMGSLADEITDIQTFDVSLTPSDPINDTQLTNLMFHDLETTDLSAFHITDAGIYFSSKDGTGRDNAQGIQFFTPGTEDAIDIPIDVHTLDAVSKLDATSTSFDIFRGNWVSTNNAFDNSNSSFATLGTSLAGEEWRPGDWIGQNLQRPILIDHMTIDQHVTDHATSSVVIM